MKHWETLNYMILEHCIRCLQFSGQWKARESLDSDSYKRSCARWHQFQQTVATGVNGRTGERKVLIRIAISSRAPVDTDCNKQHQIKHINKLGRINGREGAHQSPSFHEGTTRMLRTRAIGRKDSVEMFLASRGMAAHTISFSSGQLRKKQRLLSSR